MATRVTLLVALAFTLFAGVIRGESPTPPQKAAVVLPLLRDFSPKDTSKNTVSAKISKILGNDFTSTRHGPGGAVYELFYVLNDETVIHVVFVKGNLRAITREASARVIEILYSTSNH
jgi:hypothetical protein